MSTFLLSGAHFLLGSRACAQAVTKPWGYAAGGKACALKERAAGWQVEVSKTGRRQLELGVKWTFWERQE